MSNKKRLIITVFLVFLVGLLIIGVSYAYFSWSSNTNKNIVFNTSSSLKKYVVYDGGSSKFVGDFKVGSSYTSGVHSTISISKTNAASNINIMANINLDVNAIGTNMSTSTGIKWAVTEGSSSNIGTLLGEGNFNGAATNDVINLVSNLEVTTDTKYYTVWIWADASVINSDDLYGETIDTTIWTEINQIESIGNTFEITKIGANYQNISATVVSGIYNVTNYQVTNTNVEPSEWINISSNEQNNIYNLNYAVESIGTYYIWFKNANGNVVSTSIEVTSVDLTVPVCTFSDFSKDIVGINDTATINLTCTDNESNINDYTLQNSDLIINNNHITITNIARVTVPNGYRYTITINGNTIGTDSLTLKSNIITNGVNLKNQSVDSEEIEVKNIILLDSATVTLSNSTYTYDGTAKTPMVTVTLSGNTLVKDTDYEVTYSNNINAGTATVTITGINNYSGTKETTFTINKADTVVTLSEISGVVEVGNTITFNEQANVKGKFTVSSGTTSVATVSQASSNEINANTNNLVTINGVSNGTSTITVTFTPTDTTNYKTSTATYSVEVVTLVIKPTAANNCQTNLTYTGSSQTLTKNGQTGYTFSNNTRTNAGSQTVTATLQSGYRWTDNSNSNVTFSCSIAKATPVITLDNNNGTTFVNDTVTFYEQANAAGRFTVNSSNTTIATVSQASSNAINKNTNNLVTVTGVSKGTATITVSFVPTDLDNYNNAENKSYTVTIGEAIVKPTAANYCNTLTYNGSEQTLTKAADEGFTFSNNTRTNAGSQTVTATLQNGYVWSDKTSSNVTFSCSISKYTPTITLSKINDEVEYGNNGTFTATVNTINSCLGTLTAVSNNTTNLSITNNASTSITASNINTPISISYNAIKYSNTDINVNYNVTSTTNCNNAVQKQLSVSITDTTIPEGTLSLSQDNLAVTASITATDIGSGINKYYYKITESTYNNVCNSETTGFIDSSSNSYIFQNKTNNTDYFVCTKVQDNAGNFLYLSDMIRVEQKVYLTNLSYFNNASANTNYTYGNYFKTKDYRDKIEKIEFTNYVDTSNSVVNWDLSSSKNNAIIGWLNPNTINTSNYDLYIGSNYSIYAKGNNLANAFRCMKYVAEIDLDKLNTSEATNTIDMFAITGFNATNFSLNLGNNFDTSKVTNMAMMFSGAGQNAVNFYINLGNKFNTSKVTNMSTMFYNSGRNATNFSLNLGNDFNTSNVTDMSFMFANTTNYSFDLGNKFNTSKVTNMYYMFYNASYNISSLSLNLGNDFNTSNVTDMSFMFYNMSHNSTDFYLDLGNNFDTSNVTNMASMFQNIGYNTINFSLDLGNNFNTINATNMAWMFSSTGYKATNFSLNIKNKFDLGNVSNAAEMFAATGRHATNFSLELGNNFNVSNISNISLMFAYAGRYATNFSLNLGNNFNASNISNMSQMFADAGYNSTNFNLNLGNNFNASNVTNMSNMFEHTGEKATNFSLNFGNNFNSINVTKMVYMFHSTGLKATNFSLNIGNNFYTSNVTNMYGMFYYTGYGASGSFDLNLGNDFNTINVTNMAHMFCWTGCVATNLTLDLGDNFNTSNVKNMVGMFQDFGYKATNFSLNLGNHFNTINVTNMGAMFYEIGSNSINFDFNLGNHFDTSNVTYMAGMFRYAGHNVTNYFSLNLGNNFNAINVTNMAEMFEDVGVTSTNFYLNLGNNFNSSNVTNMVWMFVNMGRNASNFNIDFGYHFDTSKVTDMYGMFGNMGSNTKTNFNLNMQGGNFANVSNTRYMLSGFPFNYATIYVKDKTAQDWMIARSPSNFNVYNVIIDNINYMLDGGSFEYEPEYSTKTMSEDYTLPQPVRNGYTFTGWTGSNGETPQLNVIIPAGTTEIVRYFAHWEPTIMSITYNLDGGILNEPKNTYTTLETFTLGIPYKEGYIFTGWTGSNGGTEEMSVTVPVGTYGNLSYTAHYRATTNVAEESLAKLHKLGGSGIISTTTGTTSGTCFEYDNTTGDMTIRSLDTAAGRMCESIDNYGKTLVFRGNVTNNYVKYGKWGTGSNVSTNLQGKDMYWRIIRINGDGSLRMIYDGTNIYNNNVSNGDRGIGSIQYSYVNNDNAYVGYMYGDLEYVSSSTTFSQSATGVVYYSSEKPRYNPLNNTYVLVNPISLTGNTLTEDYIGYYTLNSNSATYTRNVYYKVTNITANGTNKTVNYDQYSRRSDTIEQAQENINDSTAKYYIDDWYLNKTNLNSLSSNLADVIFCNDRRVSEFAGESYNKGYGTNATYYKWYYAPWSAAATMDYPNLICSVKNDAFTVNDTTNGNGALTYPVGLITTDDAMAAGGYNGSNSTYYLYMGSNYFTMSPYQYNQMRIVYSNGNVNSNSNINSSQQIRPVINLKVDSLLSGDGSKDRPFVTTSVADTSYMISYTLNSGTITGQKTSYQIGETPFTLVNPTRVGYTFTGWTGSNGTTPQVDLVIPEGTHENLSYSANWVANDYNITLVSGEVDDTGSTSVVATYDKAMPAMTRPTKTGYAFVGYYTGENGTGTQYYTYSGGSSRNWNIANDTTLYAYWIPSVVTLNNDGATNPGDLTVTAILNSNLPTINKPEKDNYYFFGYYTNENCGGTKYIDYTGTGVRSWGTTGPLTLYACWTEPQTGTEKWGNNVYPFNGSSVNNYVTYSGNAAGWRVIGVFDNRIKLIKSSTYSYNKYHSDTTTNIWADSYAKNYLNTTFYNTLTEEAKGMISAYDYKVGKCNAAVTASEALECIATDTDSGIVGLLDIADYGMSSANCKDGAQPVSNYTTSTCRNSSWLVQDEWTITADLATDTNALRKYSYNVATTAVTTNTYYRPVVYLNANVKIIGGTGTSSEPFIVKVLE